MTQMQSKLIRSHWLRRLALTAAVAALASCGGDGGSAPVNDGASTALSLTGTAATGAAIAGGAVEVKCATGTGTGTSAANGTYTVSVTGGVLPCALRITAADGSVLHSVASGTGTSAVANLSPVTQLVVAALTGADPTTLYANFSSDTAGAVSASKVAAAVTSVVATLKSAGIDLSAVGDVMSVSLVVGNPYDQALDALKAALTSSGTTLAQLTQTVANTTTTTAPAIISATPSLPADLLLKAAASNCAALRSGRYRFVEAQAAAAGSFATGYFTLDATTLGIVNDDGSPGGFVAAGPCQYTGKNPDGTPDPSIQHVVSQAGVLAARNSDSGVFRLLITFPEQPHSVAELEGTWNKLGFTRNNATGAYAADAATVTINGSGVTTAISYCADVKNCVPVTTQTITHTLNAAGGFNRAFADGSPSDRLFAYRAGGGELMLLTIAGDGSFGVWTKQRTNALPVVGTVTNFWNVNLNNQLVSSLANTAGTSTITAVNSTTGAFARSNITTAPTTRPESLVANTPRAGYTLRNAETVTDSAGNPSNVSEFISMPLRGTGVTPVALTASGQYSVSVNQP